MKATTLQEIKEQYAKELGYNTWTFSTSEKLSESHHDEISKRYAKAKIEEAAERATMKVHDGHFKTDSPSKHVQIGANNIQIDKQSILETPLD